MKNIRALTRTSASAVNDLRRAEYAKASGFRVADSGILWNASDDQSIVLGAFEDEQLIATMRMEVIEDLDIVEKKIECPWNFDLPLRFPVMILSRAATATSHRGTGINTLMRLHALKIAKSMGVQFALGTFIADSPRARTLERMGYRFFENKLGWNRHDYKSEKTVIVAALDLEAEFEKAAEECRRLTNEIVDTYQWIAELPHNGRVTLVR